MQSNKILEILRQQNSGLGSIQTGGKGSVRRKIKPQHNLNLTQKNHIKTREENKLNAVINNINLKISTFDPDTYQIAMSFIEQECITYLRESNKFDMKKRLYKDTLKNNTQDFYNKNFIKIIENKKELCIQYNTISDVFNLEAINYLIEFFEDLAKDINQEKFENISEYDGDLDIKTCLELLDLDKNEIPDKSTLTKAYRIKSIECHPDKHIDEPEKYAELFKTLAKANKFITDYYNL